MAGDGVAGAAVAAVPAPALPSGRATAAPMISIRPRISSAVSPTWVEDIARTPCRWMCVSTSTLSAAYTAELPVGLRPGSGSTAVM